MNLVTVFNEVLLWIMLGCVVLFLFTPPLFFAYVAIVYVKSFISNLKLKLNHGGSSDTAQSDPEGDHRS